MGMFTPWGNAQTQETIAEGITEVTTASHGGIHLSPARNAQVHEAWRDPKGWYEEDCESYIVVATFPDLFGCVGPAGKAHETLKSWYPDQYENVFGVKLTAADSHVLKEREYAASVTDKIATCSAWGHNNNLRGRTRVPYGWVGVAARLGGRWNPQAEQQWFLVPEAEYDIDFRFGLVVDPQRHPHWPELEAEVPGQPVVVITGSGGKCKHEFTLSAAAPPHNGQMVGWLFRSPALGDQPETWLAYRRVGTPSGIPLRGEFTTQEEALASVGFALAPYAPVPQP